MLHPLPLFTVGVVCLNCVAGVIFPPFIVGVVLVHCVAGVSRSVTCTAAYLLSINAHLTWRQAICAIRGENNLCFKREYLLTIPLAM